MIKLFIAEINYNKNKTILIYISAFIFCLSQFIGGPFEITNQELMGSLFGGFCGLVLSPFIYTRFPKKYNRVRALRLLPIGFKNIIFIDFILFVTYYFIAYFWIYILYKILNAPVAKEMLITQIILISEILSAIYASIMILNFTKYKYFINNLLAIVSNIVLFGGVIFVSNYYLRPSLSGSVFTSIIIAWCVAISLFFIGTLVYSFKKDFTKCER